MNLKAEADQELVVTSTTGAIANLALAFGSLMFLWKAQKLRAQVTATRVIADSAAKQSTISRD